MGVSIKEVWPEPEPVGITPVVNARTIQVAIQEAESRLAPMVTLDQILVAVCEVYGFSLADLASPSRRRDLSEARAVAALLVSEQPHLRVVRLSEWLHRDVSTLFHVVRRMKERLEYDSGLLSGWKLFGICLAETLACRGSGVQSPCCRSRAGRATRPQSLNP